MHRFWPLLPIHSSPTPATVIQQSVLWLPVFFCKIHALAFGQIGFFHRKTGQGFSISYSEGDQPWNFFGRNDAKAETSVLWPPREKSWLIGKNWCWEGLGARGEGDDRGWDGWMASPTRWTWVSVNSRSWWWTGRPGMLRFMGSRRVGQDWATDHQETSAEWQPQTVAHQAPCPGDFSGRNTGVGWHFLPQAFFPIQGLNPHHLCFLNWQVESLPQVTPGSPAETQILKIKTWAPAACKKILSETLLL